MTLDGSQASEAAVKSEPLADFKVIHLAAHGVSDEMEPDRTALVLAPEANPRMVSGKLGKSDGPGSTLMWWFFPPAKPEAGDFRGRKVS